MIDSRLRTRYYPRMRKDAYIDPSSAWNKEYEQQGIPSSHREEPSGVLRWALANVPFLKDSSIDSAADLGCGTGRNAFALMEAGAKTVEAMDFSETALDIARRRRGAQSINFIQGDVTKPLPFADNAHDFVSDIFVYFHQLPDADRAKYRREIRRILKPNGLFLVSVATNNDGYYSSCTKGPLANIESTVPLTWDPVAQVGNILLSRDQFFDEFSDSFNLQMYWVKKKLGIMHGNEYLRETAAVLWTAK